MYTTQLDHLLCCVEKASPGSKAMLTVFVIIVVIIIIIIVVVIMLTRWRKDDLH